MGPDDAQLYWREGDYLGELTLWPIIDQGEHGVFEIIKGEVIFQLQ